MPLILGPGSGPSATVLARTVLSPAEALTAVADFALPQMLIGWGPFPAVTRVEGQTGRWDSVGTTRIAQLADGGQVRETIIAFQPGLGFAYELTAFTDVFDRLVHGVRGEWTAMPDHGGTMLRWTWEFAARPGRRALMHLLVGPVWRIYMQRTIDRVVAIMEERAGASRR